MSDFNPFAALIEAPPQISKKTKSICSILEEIFAFTLNPNVSEKKQYLYLEEVAKTFTRNDLDLLVLQHALFDRLFMCSEKNSALSSAKEKFKNSHSYEVYVLTYLCNCYKNLNDDSHLEAGEKAKVKSLIIQNTVTALIQSEIYEGQQFEKQMVDILKDCSPHCITFFKDTCKGVLNEEEGGEVFLKDKLSEILLLPLIYEISHSDLIGFDYGVFNVFNVFSSEEYLASIFLDAKPPKFTIGSDYAHTPLGAIFNISILPKAPNAPYEYFQDPTDQASTTATEGLLWTKMDKFTEHIHAFILSLLTCSPQIKNKTLEWLGLCIKANMDKGKLWNAHSPDLNPATYTTVSDGFMINLGNVMLRLCRPFCGNFKDKKVLKVDPTYCSVPDDQCIEKGVHLPEMTKETCLIPHDSEEGEELLVADKYNFVTECFYFAHKAISLGYQVAVDKLLHLNQDVSRIERAYLDAVAQSAGNDLVDTLKTRMTQSLTKYLCLKGQLSDPVLLALLFEFTSTSTYWLCEVAGKVEFESGEQKIFAPINESPRLFPLPTTIPATLKGIPEFIIENIVCYIVFVRRFTPKTFEEQGFDKLKPILSFILIYMGSPERVKNPHLRARLAETLESLLPHPDAEPPRFNTLGGYQRAMLFDQHEHRREIVSNLLKVFVAIEMTGQSVEFEQKFNYRRPMYSVMDYLWVRDDYRTDFKNLAQEAEKNMNAVTPPLFLRFVNLLMNDAVYLLDESLSNMAKLREMQNAKENGDWETLSSQERAYNLSYMHHIGMIAKFDNILGKDTIKTLEKLTSEITIVFTHSTMVDRVAAMLNYFLYNLVGPKKKSFKVKDQKEYSFDPATTVLHICKIYVNLKESDAFCLSISQDGRSYSAQLFELAEDVLVRIGGGVLIGELKELAERVAKKAQEQQATEEAMAEAPEHFLDPIMSTRMIDPVILPSSRQTVDRTTIARHLLSDQTDPFNRAPLSMDQVIPNTELAEEIRSWLAERKK